MYTVQYHLGKILNMHTDFLRMGMGRKKLRGKITNRHKVTFRGNGSSLSYYGDSFTGMCMSKL